MEAAIVFWDSVEGIVLVKVSSWCADEDEKIGLELRMMVELEDYDGVIYIGTVSFNGTEYVPMVLK